MKLKDFIAYLERRFPAKAEILDIQISMISDKRTGLVETVTMFDKYDDDEPTDGEKKLDESYSRKPELKLIS